MQRLAMPLKQPIDGFTIADLRLAQQLARFVPIGPHNNATGKGSTAERISVFAGRRSLGRLLPCPDRAIARRETQ
jgi:hypothetical protein